MNNVSFLKANTGDAISMLKARRDTEANTVFNDAINEIDTQASNEESLAGNLAKGTASVIGAGALAKKSYQTFLKWKSNRNKNKQEQEDGNEEEDEDVGTTNEDDFSGQMNEATEGTDTTPTQPMEVEMTEFEPVDDNVSITTVADEADTDLDTLGEYPITTSETAPFLQRTDATRDIPDIEEEAEDGVSDLADAGEDVASGITDTISNLANSAQSALSNVGSVIGNLTGATEDGVASASSSITNALSSASDSVNGLVDSATAVGETAVETGVEAGAETALGTGIEAVSTALDATGIGAVVGWIGNVVGVLRLAGGVGASIGMDVSASNNEDSQTQQAQNDLSNTVQGAVQGIQGKYAL